MKVLNRAGVEGLRCLVEDGKAIIELTVNRTSSVEAGYGRLLFRLGRGWSASFKHLSIDSRRTANTGRLSVQVPLRGVAGIVKNFYGIICAPTVKVNIPRWFDVWLMLLTSVGAPSISLSKPILTSEKVPVQASLSAEGGCLRYSLNAYGAGFRRAGLELVRQIDTGRSKRKDIYLATRKMVVIDQQYHNDYQKLQPLRLGAWKSRGKRNHSSKR